MNHNSFTPPILQADPQPLPCTPSCCLSSPPPFPFFLVWPFITQHSPLWLFSFYSHPRPLLSLSFFLSLSHAVTDFHSPSAAKGMFSFQMKAEKSCDKVVCVSVFLFVRACAGSPSHATQELLHILLSSSSPSSS